MSEHGHDNDMILLDDPEAGSTWFISLASVVLFTVTVLALSAMYFDFEGGEVDEKITAAPVKSLQELRLSQEEMLTEYGRYEFDDADGNEVKRIRIPISQAMQLEVADAKARAGADEEEEAVASR